MYLDEKSIIKENKFGADFKKNWNQDRRDAPEGKRQKVADTSVIQKTAGGKYNNRSLANITIHTHVGGKKSPIFVLRCNDVGFSIKNNNMQRQSL